MVKTIRRVSNQKRKATVRAQKQQSTKKGKRSRLNKKTKKTKKRNTHSTRKRRNVKKTKKTKKLIKRKKTRKSKKVMKGGVHQIYAANAFIPGNEAGDVGFTKEQLYAQKKALTTQRHSTLNTQLPPKPVIATIPVVRQAKPTHSMVSMKQYSSRILDDTILAMDLNDMVHDTTIDRTKSNEIINLVASTLPAAEGLFLLRKKKDTLQLVISSYIDTDKHTHVLLTPNNTTPPTYKDISGNEYGSLQDILNAKKAAGNKIILPT